MKRFDLIKKHLNGIAELFGGWANEDMNDRYLADRWQLLQIYDLKCHMASEVACDGNGVGKGSCYTADKIKNVKKAEELLETYEKDILQKLQVWFKNGELVKERFFVNNDPRGYQLKIRLSAEEALKFGIYTDWGGYGIITPEIKFKIIKVNDKKQEISWYFN